MLEFLKNNAIEILDTRGHPLAPAQFATLRAVQKGESVFQHQETIRHPDGSSLPVLVNAVRLAWPSDFPLRLLQDGSNSASLQEPAALVVHQDVTALKEAEHLKDEFLSIAAHELRTPLTVLMGYTDMLLGREVELTERQKNALSNIKKATLGLSTLVEDLLDITRIQANQLNISCAPTNIIPLMKRVAADLQQTTTRHQIEVHTTASQLLANIDPQRVEQVMLNLIGNSIKYSPQGGPIILSIWEESHMAHISVQDTGIGIPKGEHLQIFGRFTRARNALALNISGTGLGLYLCRELVQRQGGSLWFESEEGKGSTFFMTFPLISLRSVVPNSSS